MNTLIAALTATGKLAEVNQLSPTYATFRPTFSDDPCYLHVAPTGAVKVWLGRLHVDQWAGWCNDNDQAHPSEALLAASGTCLAFADSDQAQETLAWALALERITF